MLQSEPFYAEVAVNAPPVRGSFHYHIPVRLQGKLRPGHLVTAPFGTRRVQGVVLKLIDYSDYPETRPIESLVDPEPVLTPAQLQLADWLQRETLAPLIDCLTLMMPPGLSQRADSVYSVLAAASEPILPSQEALLNLLAQRGPLRGRQISRALKRTTWRKSAELLVRQGVLSRDSILDPPSVHPRRVHTVRLAVAPDQAAAATADLGRPGSQAHARRCAVIEQLIKERVPVEATWIYAESGATFPDLRKLEELGLIALGETEVWRDPLSSMDYVPDQAPQLTPDQQRAWDLIGQELDRLQSPQPRPILVHGVTGSGKTELYLRAVAETLAGGRSAIVLVPEIALTPQTVRRFLARFPGVVGLMHSRLSSGERYDTWRRSRQGQLRVIVGARSALFTPLPDIGLIVLDESHDESYKEEWLAVRYHARRTAIAYSNLLGAGCLFGSATPDIETAFYATRGDMLKVSLPQRIYASEKRLAGQAARLGIQRSNPRIVGDACEIELPPVELVDMRQELRAGNRSIFSRQLLESLSQTLAAGQQAILFLNRRGSASYVFCRDCGEALHCPRCDIPLTYHQDSEKLQCHHCGHRRQSPQICPQCSSQRVKHFGAGTQLIEDQLAGRFPGARILRWDSDTASTKGAHDIILAHFAAHRADVLIGTQMIAKGLDVPLVTLVGVISADIGLNLPDYRAAERTFQVLTQVAGRAGRGILGGKVVLQTFQPAHYAIRAAVHHDFQAFYNEELDHRRNLGYPPFRRLIRLEYRHSVAERAQSEAERMAGQLRRRLAVDATHADLIGPAPCFFRRIRGEYRWHVIVRAADPLLLVPPEMPAGWTIDVDPVSLL